jgi:ankyrin repeat protein
LAKLPSELYDTFGRTVERIKQQPKDLADLAMKILMWIHLAERPLSVDELLHALATEPGDYDLDYDNIPSRSTFLNCCLGLATIEDETSTVRLVHYSLEEYLNTQSQLFPHGHEIIVEVSLTYLMFTSSTSELISGTTWYETKPEIQETPGPPELALLRYASCEWGHHARKGHPLEERAARMTFKYLSKDLKERSGSIRYLSQQISKIQYIGDSEGFTSSFSGLHIAAFFGIHQVLLDIPLADSELDCKDCSGRTPLWWAAANGHEAVVKLLLAKDGVNIDAIDWAHQTPLGQAAANGHEAVVKLFLAKDGVNLDSIGWNAETPLGQAAANGHEAVVKLLLAKDGIKLDSVGWGGQTPLWQAAANGHEAVVKLLLAKDDVKLDFIGWSGQTPLGQAAANGHEAVVKLLLTRDDVNPDYIGWAGRTPLWQAAANGHEAVVKLLLAKDGIDPDFIGWRGQTPLWRAAANGQEAVVKLLLEKAVVVDFKDSEYGRTPLSWAAENGHEAVVRLLLEQGASVDCQDIEGRTPLSRAIDSQHSTVISLLAPLTQDS